MIIYKIIIKNQYRIFQIGALELMTFLLLSMSDDHLGGFFTIVLLFSENCRLSLL